MLRHRRPCGGIIRIKPVGRTKTIRVSCGGCGWSSVSKRAVNLARSKGLPKTMEGMVVTRWLDTEGL